MGSVLPVGSGDGPGPGSEVSRRLAVVLFADVVGYSRLMANDEFRTLDQLRRHRQEFVDPTVRSHRGRVIRTLGDGLLLEFISATDALECAVALQKGMSERSSTVPEDQRITFRIGVNLGDVIDEDGEVYGDGVNIAARLQELAEPGGICVTGAFRDAVEGKTVTTFVDLGEPELKNISRKVRVFAVASFSAIPPLVEAPAEKRSSIAVLPFDNLSADQAEEYFADGITEEIIAALSCNQSLFVIARNSTFVFKGKAVDVRDVARKLGVRYVLEGSVRRAGDSVRITVQLIDATSGGHIWASSFNGNSQELLKLQESIAASVAAAVEPHVRRVEIERARRKSTGNLTAYDLYLRALWHVAAATMEGTQEALRLLDRAIAADPRFAPALARAAVCLATLRNQYAQGDAGQLARSVGLAEAAIEADSNDPSVLMLAGHVIAAQTRQLDRGLALIEHGLRINPNSADGLARAAMVHICIGDLDIAIVRANRSLELNPIGLDRRMALCALGYAHLFARRYDEALHCARLALHGAGRQAMAYRIAIAAAAHGGRVEQVAHLIEEFRRRFPDFRVNAWAERDAFVLPEQIAIMKSGLRAAGISE